MQQKLSMHILTDALTRLAECTYVHSLSIYVDGRFICC